MYLHYKIPIFVCGNGKWWYILWPLVYFMAFWYILLPFGTFYGLLENFMAFFGIFYGLLVYFVAFWYILWPFGIFYGILVYFMAFWYIFLVLVCYTQKSLATLVVGCEAPKFGGQTLSNFARILCSRLSLQTKVSADDNFVFNSLAKLGSRNSWCRVARFFLAQHT
jgi:hypothetical protein